MPPTWRRADLTCATLARATLARADLTGARITERQDWALPGGSGFDST
ncbi:pentapeptide repeat-containing protein [Streptomyces clavifer]